MLVSHSNPLPFSTEQTQVNQSQSSLSQSSKAPQVSNESQLTSVKSLNPTRQTLQQDTVTLSPRAIELAKKNPNTDDVQMLPAVPALPNEGEKIEVYIEYKKAKMQYQIYSDMANIATGNSNAVSPTTAYYLSNNEDARAATVNGKAQQQQVATMQTYVDTTQSLNELN
ncbi:conserved hypothetical protein [Shewanella halifaxensis HAW-EB4]|uniref:Uncharacterized protein n=1 Tax=Shewanella halifaxensis (strain HAW-EB4) TaxID=458817 RepID=B0TKM1_SHEHH|nr:hypothetical protein [Shewanella halifaxensis]ABZ75823.1 conserved hypothetical protein [Shewanella halifaxensis HAW-EB4]